MLNYIIQVLLFQTLFFMVFEYLLKKETFFTGNRIYLLATQALVVVLPFIHFPKLQKQVPLTYQNLYTKGYVQVIETLNSSSNVEVTNTILFQWQWVIYLGIALSGFLFLKKLYSLYITTKNAKQFRYKEYTLMQLEDTTTAFSFCKAIFIGALISKKKQQEIITHELIHVTQKHSWDLLFFEAIRILFWWNPLVYIYQKRITEVHEYYVDYKLNKANTDKNSYFESLLSEIFQTKDIRFTSSFYKASLIKKRIQMLTKMKSKNRQLLKYFFIVPVMAITVTYVSCNEKSKQLAVLVGNSEWHTTDYKSGETIKAFQYMPQVEKNGNSLNITNYNFEKDMVVKVIENDTDTMYRDVYIKSKESAKIENIPLGKYYLKTTTGSDWQEICIQNKCFGKFSKNESYQRRYFEHLLEFKINKTVKGNDASSIHIKIN